MGIDYSRLAKAISKSYDRLKTPRENRFKFLKESVGKHYGDGGTEHPVPINIIRLAQNVYTRMLVASNPKVLISTRKQPLKMSAIDQETGLNQLIEEIKLKKKLRRFVTDAMFGIGVMKVGISSGKSVYIDGVKYEVGQPYAETVDLDNFGLDMNARVWDDAQYMFDISKVSYEWAISQWPHAKKILDPEKDSDYKRTKDVSSISKGNLSKSDKDEMSYKLMCDIASVYLPEEKRIVRYAWINGKANNEVLDDNAFYGPECGPYIPLYFNEVSGNVLPLPPVALWYDIHELANELYRKLGRQARRQKDITLFDPKNKDDANRIKDSIDGEIIACRQPDRITTTSHGGVNQGNFAFFLNSQQQANKMTGNSDTLGGMGATSETATQDKLIMGTATQQVADMQEQVEEATTKICQSLAWYMFYDPFIQMPATKRLPGIPIDIPIVITSEMMEGDFLDYNYTIKPYSLQEDTPSSKFNTLTSIFTNLVLPMAPMLEQQNMTIDFQEFMDLISRLKNIPELEDILINVSTEGKEKSSSSKVFGTPPIKTTREYVRRDRGSESPEEKSANKIVNSFIGAGGM